MPKSFAMIVGWLLVAVGILTFFAAPIKLMPAQAAAHIIAGLLGIWAARSHAVGYALWVGIVGALLGFLNIFSQNFLNLVDLPMWTTIVHFALSAWGFLTYWVLMSRENS